MAEEGGKAPGALFLLSSTTHYPVWKRFPFFAIINEQWKY
jgi:hypothetical protein